MVYYSNKNQIGWPVLIDPNTNKPLSTVPVKKRQKRMTGQNTSSVKSKNPPQSVNKKPSSSKIPRRTSNALTPKKKSKSTESKKTGTSKIPRLKFEKPKSTESTEKPPWKYSSNFGALGRGKKSKKVKRTSRKRGSKKKKRK